MLANTTKPQPNSKILSIYDKSSSRGGISSLSTSMSSNNPSQRFSQSNLSRPNHSLFSQSLLSAQDHPSFISPSIDSQKFPFSFPCNSQRSQPLSDPSQNPYGLALSRPNYTTPPPYQNYISETIPTQDYAPFQNFRGPTNSYHNNSQQHQKYSLSSLKKCNMMERYPISQMEYENTMQQFPQAQAGSMNIEKPANEEATSQIAKLSSTNEISQKDNEQELRSPMDELGNQLMTNLEKLKNELKEEVEKCADVQEARETVIKHFDTFEEGLKQILETYEQFGAQLKRIEEVFMMQTKNIIQSFVENSEDLDKMEQKIEQKVTSKSRCFYNKIHRMYEPIKQTISNQMLNKKRKSYLRNHPNDVRIPGLYDKVLKPFPSYASAHCYETRNAVIIVDKKQYELEVIEDHPTMEIEPQKEEVTQLTKAKRHPDDPVVEKKKQQQQRWRI